MTRQSDDERRSRGFASDESGSSPVIGDVLMVGIAVLFVLVAAVVVLDLVGILAGEDSQTVVEFEYEGDVPAETTDSFGRTNENGNYDGLLTVRHAHGTVLPADELRLRGASNLDGSASWLATDGSGGVPADGMGDEFGAGDRLTVWVRDEDTVRVVRDIPDEGTVVLGAWER